MQYKEREEIMKKNVEDLFDWIINFLIWLILISYVILNGYIERGE